MSPGGPILLLGPPLRARVGWGCGCGCARTSGGLDMRGAAVAQAPARAAASSRPGGFVLYWMRKALRAHENPALDVGACGGPGFD
jgi:hypothetical protein